jgi:hypothetical protein
MAMSETNKQTGSYNTTIRHLNQRNTILPIADCNAAQGRQNILQLKARKTKVN